MNSILYFLLFLAPFSVSRIYIYFNYYFSSHDFQWADFFWMLVLGFRFDLCVIGFLLIPIYLLYWVAYIPKLRTFAYLIAQAYKLLALLVTFLIFHFNIPFISKNTPFDLPYWMHWPDYKSMLFLDCTTCFWDYDYMSTVYPLQIVSGVMFLIVVFGFFSGWNFFSEKMSFKREILIFSALVLMARGKVGQHHLRYEDSIWHKDALINTLSNNPLWLMDKIRRP